MTQAVCVSLKGTAKDIKTNFKSNLLSKINSSLKHLLQRAVISTTKEKKNHLYWYYPAAKLQTNILDYYLSLAVIGCKSILTSKLCSFLFLNYSL